MMNATEATEAAAAVPYPHGAPREERAALRAAYDSAQADITGQFKEFLAEDYASHLPVEVQNRIWGKAWEDGHSSGYHEVEHHYGELADFATAVVAATR